MANRFSHDSVYLWGRSSLIFVFYYPYSYYLVFADIAAEWSGNILLICISISLFFKPYIHTFHSLQGISSRWSLQRFDWPHSSFLFSTSPPIPTACRYRLGCSRTKPKVILGTGEKVSTERLRVKIRFWECSSAMKRGWDWVSGQETPKSSESYQNYGTETEAPY